MNNTNNNLPARIQNNSLTKVSHSISVTKKLLAAYDSRVSLPKIESIKIGEQEWMSKNLDVTHYRNGDPIPEVTNHKEWAKLESGAWCYHENNPESGLKRGRLYNWYALMDKRGICPDGWRIPTRLDWLELNSYYEKKWDISSDLYHPEDILHQDFPLHAFIEMLNKYVYFDKERLSQGIRMGNGIFLGDDMTCYWWAAPYKHNQEPTVIVEKIWFNFSRNDKGIGTYVRCIKD